MAEALHSPNSMHSHSNILGSPQCKQHIALMPRPLQSAKNLPSSPSRRSILHQLGSQWPLVSMEVDRSLSCLAFILWKSIQKCRPLSFLHTNTTALHHGHWLGQRAPTSNIPFTFALTSSTIGGGILQNLSLKGSSSMTLISCLPGVYSPTLQASRNKFVVLASRAQVAAWFFIRPPLQTR